MVYEKKLQTRSNLKCNYVIKIENINIRIFWKPPHFWDCVMADIAPISVGCLKCRP